MTAPTVLRFRGARALSDFRLAKLVQELKVALPAPAAVRGVAAEFWHFVEADAAPGAQEKALLERLLRYGTPPEDKPAGEVFLVVPRLGTISPWASKATDIARNCGLTCIRRIERGILFSVDSNKKTDRARIAALLHDRMTESVLGSLEEADGMFRHVAPRPLARVPLAQLEAANASLGLALNDEEIAYLRDAYRGLGRDPTDAELAAATGLKPVHLAEAREAMRTVVSLDRPIGGADEETPFGALLPAEGDGPDEEVAVSLDREAVRRAVAQLPERQREVVRMRYGIDGSEPQRLSETGRALGISAERVRQIENAALRRLAEVRELQGVRAAA